MLVRITQRPPISYDATGDSLLVGRTYDLPASLAAALMAEGCADFIERRREERQQHGGGFTLSQAHDRRRMLDPKQAANVTPARAANLPRRTTPGA